MKTLLTKTVLKITGNDCESFLQGQFSNDITKATDNNIQLNCYLQHQGKIIALLWLIKEKNCFYLLVENELVDIVVKRLNMFKVISDVIIEITNFAVIGVLGNAGRYQLNAEQSIDLELAHDYEADEIWQATCIENNVPEVYLATSEKFTPEVLNIATEGVGVSFTKGCYVGQEVVARMHYLGKPKRSLFRFNSENEVKVGDELIISESNSQKASGIVVSVVKLPAYYLFLATLEVKFKTSKITINNQAVNLLN
jgi:folate-binding protein YgfZ